MPAKAKLYASESEFDSAVSTLEERFSLGVGEYCPKEQVVKDGDDKNKYILPLPDKGSFKSNHLFGGVVDFNASWFNED